MNTGARVTYAMGKDAEVPEHFGLLHAGSLSPRKSIWTLAWISAVIGVIAISLMFGDAGAPSDATIAASFPVGDTCRTTRWPSCPTRCSPSPSPPTSALSSSTG